MAANDGFNLPGSVLPSTAAPQAAPPATVVKPKAKPSEQPVVKDVFREVVETVVFVIVLVFLLKIFVAEAFVIPTGSMAETLLGYQRFVECPQCKISFPVNCSQEVDPQDGREPTPVDACTCPNCRFREVWREPVGANPRMTPKKTLKEPPGWGSGDRVLVSKFPFDKNHLDRLGKPKRFDVVVFKFPLEPQKGFIPMNYIKRLIGLPGDTLAIYNGDLYVLRDFDYPPESHTQADRPEEWWRKDYAYENDAAAVAAFNNNKFSILRKPTGVMIEMRRLVNDNDHQPADLVGKAPPRWQMWQNARWTPDSQDVPKVFRHDGSTGNEVEWVRYQHLIVDRGSTAPLDGPVRNLEPQFIRNFMGYNAGEPSTGRVETNWVGDLMVECTAQIETQQGELILELSEGPERFQARFDLSSGACSLVLIGLKGEKTLATKEGVLTKPGSYKLRFANFDDRLTLWVDGKLPFDEGVEYEPALPDPEHRNNLEPASVGVRGGAKVAVSQLRLWRDTCYTTHPESPPSQLGVKTLYVQPGHYLCLGDNSSESSDSRFWGLVPQRLMLGRALLVYWPLTRAGVIR